MAKTFFDLFDCQRVDQPVDGIDQLGEIRLIDKKIFCVKAAIFFGSGK